MSLRVLEWGRTEYGEALARQEEIFWQRLTGQVPDTLILTEHRPVITLGRQGDLADLLVPPTEIKGLGIQISNVGRAMSRLKIVTSLPQHQATVESLARAKVNTICLESNCPNVGGCFSRGTATFLILGTVCTRSCAFCAVDKGKPLPPDPAEPFRVTGAARELGLKRVVITSVTRDDLEDGGAGYFAQTVRLLKAGGIEEVEVLIPDFQGSEPNLAVVLEARPDIFAHNLETVPRLYPSVRPGACYQRSLRVIEKAAGFSANLRIKAGIMLGLGEQESEVLAAMKDLLQAGCNMLTLGQYLQPTIAHLPVAEYLTPEMFEKYRLSALDLGFQKVWSGPLVRSSIAY